jgi:hypothetical protein
MQRLNAAVPGTVTLHYKARDITVDVVGDVAFRMMTWFRRGRAEGLADSLDPRVTSSLDPWITMDRRGLLAITWDPGPDVDVAVPKDVLALLGQMNALLTEADSPARPPRDGGQSPAHDEQESNGDDPDQVRRDEASS